MQPIAIYEEGRPEARHRFELYADAICVRGWTLQTEVDATIPLAQLGPSIVRVWSHSWLFYVGFWVFLLGIVLLMIVVTVAEMKDARSFPAKPMGLVGSVAAVGMALVLSNRRKIEYVQFRSDAGVPILAIARAAKGGPCFDQFVALLVEHVRQARGEDYVGGPA